MNKFWYALAIIAMVIVMVVVLYKPVTNIFDARACENDGGEWKTVGILRNNMCIYTYSDAGNPCTSSDECEGRCMIEKGNTICEDDNNPFGCFAWVEQPYMICAD